MKSDGSDASADADSTTPSDSDSPPDSTRHPVAEAASDGTEVRVALDGGQVTLDRETAIALRDDLSDALAARREFLHTAGEHRPDGSYAVERRAADSAGHCKVFERFADLRRLYERLPKEFTAEAVEARGVTGGRRHLLVRHLAEHPAFDCELVSRQPLTARKRGSDDPERERGGEGSG